MSSGDESSSRPVRALKNGRRSIWKGWPDSSFPVSDETLGRPFISSALAEAKSQVDQAYKYTRDLSKMKYKKRSLSPSDLLSFFKQPAADTRSAVRAAEYMENTLSLITQRVHKIHRRSLNATAIHTLFVREHNRLARELKILNPHWNGEILFQEARKIIGAYHQFLIYREYLPRIVGREAVDKYLKTYSGYDESVDPGVANVFSTAAFRFAHLTIQPFMFRLNETYQEHPKYPSVLLHKAFFTPWRLVFEGGIDPILRGLIGNPAKLNTQDKMMHEELRERLFKLTSHLALDLGSLNIQRSRDHGLPGYNDWRRFCGLSQPKTVNELAAVLNNTNLAVKLLGLYGSPDNIDVWMGGIAEPFASNARVGPLFACLITTQFQKIRNGDRFWWENSGTFTENQRNSLRTVSLSRIICDNTKIQEVPQNVFQYIPYSQGYTRCSQIPSFDLSPWQENTSGKFTVTG
ncbi:PERM Myeloperoxidase, partial [Polyodon spathula]|nr:PERM Myeloperoxidase [Polyodon spathula]